MRKRSASESGRGNSPDSQPHPTPSKLRKIRHSSNKEDINKTTSRRKPNLDSNSGKRKGNSAANVSDGTLSSDSNSVRRSHIASGSSDDGPTTRESKKASLINYDAKHRQEPLPDIMHDWEIIVNSLRENTPNGEPTASVKSKSYKLSNRALNSKPFVSSSKHDFTDSDKENTTFKRKTEEFATPPLPSKLKQAAKTSHKEEKSPKKSISPSKQLISPSKQTGSPSKPTGSPSKSESSEEPEWLWRRPTRSTYKAFEDVFDPSMLIDDLVGKSPPSLDDIDKKLHSSEPVIKLGDSPLLNKVSKSPKMVPPRKRMRKTNENLSPGRRRITRQMEKDGQTTDNFFSPTSEDDNSLEKSENEELIDNIDRDYIVTLTKLDFEDSFDQEEPDFLGFGSPQKMDFKQASIRSGKSHNLSPSKSPERKRKIGRPRKKSNRTSGSPVRQIIEECKLDESEESDDAVDTIDTSLPEHFESIFGPDDSKLPCNFEGFNELHPKGRYCSHCHLLLRNMDELKQHKKIAHKRIYSCIFDTGNCGQFKGSATYGCHLTSAHKHIIAHLSSVIQSDIKFSRIANWVAGEEPCTVCFVSLSQPGKCLHEMVMHGLWPPSLLSLIPVSVDQYITLWWTGKNLSFICRLCYSSQSGKKNAPIIMSSAQALPNLIANHLRNVHLINLPQIQGWWLLLQLLLSLPYGPRKTLSSLITLTVNTEFSSYCSLCSSVISIIDFKRSSSLCFKCSQGVHSINACWFSECSYTSKSNINNLLAHILEVHNTQLPGGWCVQCGEWDNNLLSHLTKCSTPKEICIFCEIPIHENVLPKAAHSFTRHSQPCPLPYCFASLPQVKNNDISPCFPTQELLFSHLVINHLPEWSTLSIEELFKLISSFKGSRGYMLTHGYAKNFEGTWLSLSKHVYTLASGLLSLNESIKISRVCFLCARTWLDTLMHIQKDVGSVCEECLGTLHQWDNGYNCSYQCPVFSCLEKIYALDVLFQHLIVDHKLHDYKEHKKYRCCSYQPKSPISTIFHNLRFHCQSCLACDYTAATSAQIKSHRSIVHGFLTWNTLFHHLKSQESKKNKRAHAQYGVMRVWQGDTKIQAQLDPTIDVSALNCEDLENESPMILSCPSDPTHLMPTTQKDDKSGGIDSWCSSLCAVSMSPCKVTESNTTSLDKDIHEEVSNVLRKLDVTNLENNDTESDYNSASPDLLIPSISMNEQPNSNSTQYNNVADAPCKIGNNGDLYVNDQSPHSISSGDAPLEIDSSAPSPEPVTENASIIQPSITNGDINDSNRLTVTIPVSISDAMKDTGKAPENSEKAVQDSNVTNIKSNDGESDAPHLLKFMDIMVAETLQSMTKAFSNPLGSDEPKKATSKTGSNSKKEKGLGENASFDETSMAENILKDLEEKFNSTCVNCGVSIHLPDLSYHLKSRHPGRMPYCQCGFKGELNAFLVHSFHMSHIPCEARPFLFTAKDSLDSEAMIVLEARPDVKILSYPCFKCGKRFKQEKSRQLHYNLCKLEKKFHCDICGEKFALENHLLKHKEWKHNPQTCSYCKKVFNSSSSLAQHIQHIHKKQLVHNCKQCKDSFNTLSQLKVHIRTHTGEEPHTCHICTLGFISRNLLRKHLASDHKEESSSDDESDVEATPHKLKKLNKRKTSNSSSEDSDQEKGSKKTHKDTEIQINLKSLPLTESDLETSISESEQVQVTIPKKNKQQNKVLNIANHDLNSKSPMSNKLPQAGSLILPELRHEVREKVKTQVGKVCNPCGQEFESPVRKLLHLYLIHPGFVLSLGFNQCCFCDFKFSNADDVSDHHLAVHQRTSLPNGNFRCLCGLTFREEGAYYFHLYYAHKAQRALNVGGEIVCRLCEGRPRLNKIVDLVVHLSDRHTMFDHVRFNDSYMCNLCYKAFESWTVLSLHFFMVHKATKSQTLSYDCPYCQGASPWHSLEALQYHLDNVHRGRHNKSQPVPEETRGIYTPAPAPSSPTKKKELPSRPNPPKRQRKPKQSVLKSMEADPDILYCTCQCPYDEVSDMIGCDNPNCKYQWFHFECVGIMAAPEGNWYCPDCVSFAQQKEKEDKKKRQIQADLYEYYSNLQTEEKPPPPSATKSHRSSNSSNSSSSGSSSSSSSNSSSSSSSSSDSSSESEAN